MNPGPLRTDIPPRPCAACGFLFKPNTKHTKNCKRLSCIKARLNARNRRWKAGDHG